MGTERETRVAPLHSYVSNILARIRYFLPLMVMILSVFIDPVKADTLTLSLTTGDDYPPFTDRKLPLGGMATTLVISAFEKSGYLVKEIEWLPWKRGYTLALRGRYHATFPYGWTPERAESFYFSDPFFPTKKYAWSRLGQANTLTNEEDLQGTVYCNPRGYADFGKIKELIDRNLLRRETPNSMLHCFKMLLQKRVDFVSAAPNDAIKALLEAGISPKEVQRSGFVITEIPLHVIVPKHIPKAQDIIDAFNKGLIILRENGRYEVLQQEFHWLE